MIWSSVISNTPLNKLLFHHAVKESINFIHVATGPHVEIGNNEQNKWPR